MVNRLLIRIEKLEAENADLCRQLGQNASNSDKPPSSEGYILIEPLRKPLIETALPKSAGEKPSRQRGHKGKTFQSVELS